MKIIQTLKGVFKNNKYQELESKIDSLEKRVFEKKSKAMGGLTSLMSSYMFFDTVYEPETLEKEIDILQDKVDALCKHFKVRLEKTSDREGQWVVRKNKK